MSVIELEIPPKMEEEADASFGDDLRACRGCLSTKVPLHDLHKKGFAQLFGEFTGFAVIPSDGYPQYACDSCLCYLRKFYAFRTRCHNAMFTLQQMRAQNPLLTTKALKSIENSHLKPNLTPVGIELINYKPKRTPKSKCSLKKLAKSKILTIDVCGNDVTKIEECMVNEVDLTEESDHINHEIDDTADDKDTVLDDKHTAFDQKDVKERNKYFIKEEDDKKIKDDDDSDDEDIPLNKFSSKSTVKAEINDHFSDDNDNGNFEDDILPEPVLVLTKIENEETSKSAKVKDTNKKKVVRKRPAPKPRQITKAKSRAAPKRPRIDKKSKISELEEGLVDDKEVLEVWKTIFDEINDENQRNQPMKRKLPDKHEIKLLMIRAEKFSKTYNTEVRFLSKEEQIRDIEDRRKENTYSISPFRCDRCYKVFTVEDTFKRHMLLHDPTIGDLECEICKYRFKTRATYKKHYNTLHVKKFICKECGIINRSWSAAKQHFEWHGGATVTCEFCDKTFSERKHYSMHLRSKHGAGATKCPLCEDSFIGETGLRVHLNRAHRQSVRCDTCSTTFFDTNVRKKHIDNSVDDKCDPSKSPCSFCGDILDSEAAMQQHYEALHKREFKCTQCNKSFPTSQHFSRHMHRHYHPETYCTKLRSDPPGPPGPHGGPPSAEALRRWKARREDKKTWMCEVCGKDKFPSRATLQYHQRTHTGERPYQCAVCSKSFTIRQSLTMHMTTHTDERKHKCPVCPKAFRQQAHKMAHMLTHTKERPYACTACPKTYTGASALKDHVNVAHRGLPPRKWGKKLEDNHM